MFVRDPTSGRLDFLEQNLSSQCISSSAAVGMAWARRFSPAAHCPCTADDRIDRRAHVRSPEALEFYGRHVVRPWGPVCTCAHRGQEHPAVPIQLLDQHSSILLEAIFFKKKLKKREIFFYGISVFAVTSVMRMRANGQLCTASSVARPVLDGAVHALPFDMFKFANVNLLL